MLHVSLERFELFLQERKVAQCTSIFGGITANFGCTRFIVRPKRGNCECKVSRPKQGSKMRSHDPTNMPKSKPQKYSIHHILWLCSGY